MKVNRKVLTRWRLILLEKAIRSQFVQYFPNPEAAKKKKTTGKASVQTRAEDENPYKAITRWFDGGNHLDLLLDSTDANKHCSLV